MPFANSSGIGVLNNYGARGTRGDFGGRADGELLRVITYDIDVPNAFGIAAAAWAVEGLDLIIPTGSVFRSVDFVVETAFNTLTALTVGLYAATNGTTAVSVDGLITAAGSALTTIDAVGDRLVGAGALLATGTAGLGATTSNTVVRTLYTGAAPTTGKARLIVQYWAPTP